MGKKQEFPHQRAKIDNERTQHEMAQNTQKQQKPNTTKHQSKLYLGQQL
jgi:hypothetical protein